jgi:hypothetical protein
MATIKQIKQLQIIFINWTDKAYRMGQALDEVAAL